MVGQRLVPDDEDRAEVELLHARLEKTILLTKKIRTSQSRLETSGKSVQEAIGPVYSNTQRLQVLGNNIDRVHEAIEKLRQPLNVRAQEERIIRSGPNFTGIAEYLASLRRIGHALAGLTSSNLRSNQEAIHQLKTLASYGTQQVEEIFRRLLAEESSSVEPLHYITKQIPFPSLSAEKCSLLSQINVATTTSIGIDPSSGGYLTSISRTYSDVRAQYLASTLQNLAAASLNTARKRSPDAVYRRGSNGIGTYSISMEGLFLVEYDNIRQIFSQGEWSAVFNATCRVALTEYAKTLEELNAHVQQNLATDCFLAYEIVDIVSTLSFRMGGKTGELKEPLTRALQPVRETAKASLRELLDEIRRRIMQIQVLPSDGAVIPITNDTMSRLQNMPEFVQPLMTILVSLGDGNWSARSSSETSSGRTTSPMPFDVGADGHQLFTHYCMDVVETLLHNLESKARTLLRHRTILGVFIANNVAVIDRAIRTSELQSLMSSSMSRIEAWRKKGVSLYLDGWKDPSAYLLDVQYTNRGGQRPPSGNTPSVVNSAEIIRALGNKEKDAIKDKFRGFNISFDEMVARHRNLALEREIRAQLAREVQAMIEPLYGRFWDRYHEIDKGKGKYVKFDKAQLAATLAALG